LWSRGTHDGATPPAETRRVADAVPGARYVELDASHLSNVEQASRFTEARSGLPHQSRDIAMDDSERYEAGMKVRRAVLGDAHVERTLTKTQCLQ